MSLTSAQLATLKADIAANTTVINGGPINELPNNSDANTDIANWYNGTASPDFIVWKTNVTDQEIMQNGFNWTRVDNLSVGKARIWDWMFRFGSIDASKTNIRDGIDSVWVGTQADLDVRAAVYVHCKRLATRLEKLLATGTGTTNSPATMGAESPITHQDVEAARTS